MDKGRTVSRNAYFVALNVGTSVVVCRSKLDLDIWFATVGQPDDPSHTGIYGMEDLTIEEKTAVAAALAKSVMRDEVYSIDLLGSTNPP